MAKKKVLVAVSVLGLAALLPVLLAYCRPARTPLRDAYDRVRDGMSLEEVVAILGKPDSRCERDRLDAHLEWDADGGKERVYIDFLDYGRNGHLTVYGKRYEPETAAEQLWRRADAGVSVYSRKINYWLNQGRAANRPPPTKP